MAKLSKNRKEVLAKYDTDSIFNLDEAIKIRFGNNPFKLCGLAFWTT